MAFIPGFENDIFISYAHLDNCCPKHSKTEGWVKRFLEYLELYLAQQFGTKKFQIWWDQRKLDATVLFDDAIADGIKKTAVMICLNSPSYGESEYCQKELDLFYNKAQKDGSGLKIGHRSRIVHVLLRNIPFEKWPNKLSGTSGVFFNNPKFAGLGWVLNTDTAEFEEKMMELISSIYLLIDDFTKLPNTTNEGTQPVGADTEEFTIYVGDIPDSLECTADLILTELKKEGYKIIKDNAASEDIKTFETNTTAAINGAQLSVHLLDQFPGPKIGGETLQWYRKKEIELALESDIPQFIWFPKGVGIDTIKNKDYKAFINGLRTVEISEKKEFDFNDNGIEDNLKKDIFDTIDTLIAKQNSAEISEIHDGNGSPDIFLDYNMEDKVMAAEIETYLIANNLGILNSPSKETLEENFETRNERLKETRKLIVLYGKASKKWVYGRLQKVIGNVAVGKLPIEEIFIYMGPEPKESDDIMIFQEACKLKVINNSTHEKTTEKVMEQFINNLKSAQVE